MVTIATVSRLFGQALDLVTLDFVTWVDKVEITNRDVSDYTKSAESVTKWDFQLHLGFPENADGKGQTISFSVDDSVFNADLDDESFEDADTRGVQVILRYLNRVKSLWKESIKPVLPT